MKRTKRVFSLVVVFLLTVFTLISNLPAKTASAAVVVPKIQFASPPVTQYTAGDRVGFNINAPNYGGRVQYRVVLWNDSEKTYYDLWNSGNGYPERYYTKWQPYGNEIFTLGWIIFDPGSYRITVYAKRAGIANNKTALKGFNCDSYMESVAFTVKSKEAAVESVLPVSDVTVMQGATPTLPSKVKVNMSDGLIKEYGVTWGAVNTSNPGTFTIEGIVAGTTKKAYVKVNVTSQTAINVYSVVSVSNYLVNVTLKDPIYTTPEASKFSIKSYNNNTTVPIQSVSLSSDKKTVSLTTGYLATNSWYTLTVNNSSVNFIGNQGTTGGISLAAQNKDVAVNGTIYASVTKYPSDVTLTYYSSNINIATVHQTTGLITGKCPGVTTITVYGNKTGYSQVTTTFTVTVGGQSGMYAYAQNMEIGVGEQKQPTITKYPSDLTLNFTSNNTSIATVEPYTGLVKGVSRGIATITIAASKYGYSTVYSTFTVTVSGQAMTINAGPLVLKESSRNDGSLESATINVVLTGSTFYNWNSNSYYKNYVDVYNLPYNMDYTVKYVNNYILQVDITGKAVSHRDSDDQNIQIVVSRDIVNGAIYELTSNNVLLDFTNYPTPAAPTNPIVDNENNKFGWTYNPEYRNASDYEYSVDNGAHWANCNANPQSLEDMNYPTGTVKVRVRSGSDRNTGLILSSNAPFTKTPDASKPILRTFTMTFTKGDGIYNLNPDASGTYNVPTIVSGREIAGMELRVNDDGNNLNTNPVNLYYENTNELWGILKHYSGGLWKLDINTCTSKVFDESINLVATFTDGSNNTKATIKTKVVTITGIDDIKEKPIVQDTPYTLPEKIIARVSDAPNMLVDVTWDPITIDTSTPGEKVAWGTVDGYLNRVKLTITVTSRLTRVFRTSAEIRQDPGKTGGGNLEFLWQGNQKLSITGYGVPLIPKGANGNPPNHGYWVGVAIDRPAQAVGASYFVFGEQRYDVFDYPTGFWFYFELEDAPITFDIQWGDSYIETLTIQCTAAPEV